jgi:hypothetical protein
LPIRLISLATFAVHLESHLIFTGWSKNARKERKAEQWGFNGIRMSDWGAVHDGLQAALAGRDLEMPDGNNALMSSANLYPSYQSGQLTKQEISELTGISQAAGSNIKVDYVKIGDPDPIGSTRQYLDGNPVRRRGGQ